MTWYDKPRALRCPPTQVRLPAIISPATSQPKRRDCALFIVWSRALFILNDYFNTVETLTEEELVRQIDHCCNQLIELHDDWDLSSVARSPKLGQFECWMYAETVIAFHSIIIIMRRKIMAADQAAHPQAVQSARAIISIIHEWSRKDLALYGGCFNTQWVLLPGPRTALLLIAPNITKLSLILPVLRFLYALLTYPFFDRIGRV